MLLWMSVMPVQGRRDMAPRRRSTCSRLGSRPLFYALAAVGVADGGRRRKTFSEKLLERRDFVTRLWETRFCLFVFDILPLGPLVWSGGRGLVVGRQHETRCTSWGKAHLEAERLGENGTVFYGRRDISGLETSRLCEARGLKKGPPDCPQSHVWQATTPDRLQLSILFSVFSGVSKVSNA